jgi:hypothetical protein
MAEYSGVAPGQDWAALFIAVIGWLILAISLSTSFGKTARRIRDAYQGEHATLFPHAALIGWKASCSIVKASRSKAAASCPKSLEYKAPC